MAPKTKEEISLSELISRLDERSIAIQNQINTLSELLKKHEERIEKNEEKFVRKEQFIPVQKAVYAIISVVTLTVLSIILSHVLMAPVQIPTGH
jgi:SUMO ligase MMS21 Smc5/6 complex component